MDGSCQFVGVKYDAMTLEHMLTNRSIHTKNDFIQVLDMPTSLFGVSVSGLIGPL